MAVELLLIWIACALPVALMANRRGRSGLTWLLLALALSPLIALIAVILVPQVETGTDPDGGR